MSKSVAAVEGARLETSVTVREEFPVSFEVPLQRETRVNLSEPVRVEGATVSIQSVGFSLNGPATITLPAGTELPLALDLRVPVESTVPAEFTVPVEIPLAQTDLHRSLLALQEGLSSYAGMLEGLPDCWAMLLWDGSCP
jgi:hypothetical protein